MKTNLKIQIDIETEINIGFKCNFEIYDYLTNYSTNTLSAEQFIENYKTAIKKINKKFSTITISIYKHNPFTYTYENTIFSKRYINKYGNIESSNFDGYKYYEFTPSEFKDIEKDIKQAVEIANKQYIKELQTV